MLATIAAAEGLTGPRNAATAAPITGMFAASPPPTLSGSVVLSSATENAALPSLTKIATFTDTNKADAATGFTATIRWGDGTSSAGTISGSNGAFTVSAGHTYADEGSFALSATIKRTADNTTITPTGTVASAEADVLTPHAATITGTAGQALNNVTVATFTDTNTANAAGDFAAAIKWGDGTTSAGTVSGSKGTFTVTGSHTYAAAGTNAVAVTLTDDAPGTATATANSNATIGPASGTGGVPKFSHIVVVMEENHSFNEIIGNSGAPYINGTLAAGGALLTNYFALTHPSEPNYFGIYAGSTFGVTDDNAHSEPDPTLATVLQAAGKSFAGYVESGGSDFNHNPWESFPEGFSV